ncbi:baseplate assembly protein [Hoeflea sp.]|uniref:baseplate assembly protein n=1 Tax=Hoeflea sp. TaxID=1940281 RepID=UPI00374862E0
MKLTDNLLSMSADIAMLRSAFGNSLKVGPIEEVDAVKGYRIKLGEANGKPFLSPWQPHPESGKSSVPLRKGDIVGVVSPSGDMRQGVMFRAGYSGPRPSPNDDMNANVFEDAGVRVTLADGALVLAVGGVTFRFSGAGFVQDGGRQEHNGKNVGSDHGHVSAPLGPPGPPV